jgi:hypothetical protein
MNKYIYIVADTNDGDYVSEMSLITDEMLEKIKPVINAIKAFEPYEAYSTGVWRSKWTHTTNYPCGEANRADLGEKSAEELYGHIDGFKEFDQFVPNGEYGIHSIESIKVFNVESIEELL